MNKLLSGAISGTTLTALALLILLASNLIGIARARDEMGRALERQDQLIAEGTKVEQQLEALAQGTRALADSGNPNARKIVDLLRQNGINIAAPKGN